MKPLSKTKEKSANLRKFKPHGYQRKTIKFFVERAAAGAFLDPGLGKTMISYCAFDILRELKHVKRLFVVTLMRPAYKVWPSEVKKWGLPFKVHVLHGKGKKPEFLRDKSIDVFVINYEGLEWLLTQLEELGMTKGDMLVFDESSKLRNTNTQRFHIVRKLIGYFKRRYILTGTPTPKGLINLFGQIYALDAGDRLGRYITHFRNKYFTGRTLGAGGPVVDWQLNKGAEQQIYAKLRDVVIRFGEEELDHVPKLVPREFRFDLPDKARRIYDDLERDLITAIDNQVVFAKNAGIATQKLRQVANGGLYLPQSGEDKKDKKWKLLHDAKTDAVEEIIDGLEGKPALIGYEFHHDLERLKKRWPKVPCLTDAKMKEYEVLEREWNAGNLEMAFAQVAALAHGNNLQESQGAIILHSFVWDYEAYDQFIKRIRRQGNKAKRTYVYYIIAENTVDEDVIKSWGIKGATQNDLFKALKARIIT